MAAGTTAFGAEAIGRIATLSTPIAASPVLTLAEAAARLGVTPDTLRQQIANGRLRGKKVGPIWVISEKELDRYRRESRRS